MDKTEFKGMFIEEIADMLRDMGEPKFRANQICDWIFHKKAESFDEMTNLPSALREALNKTAKIGNLDTIRQSVSKTSGAAKFLFGLEDGGSVETVLMRHDYGTSVCVSTQVGCKMSCSFCASAIGGFVRNLSAWEIVDQVIKAEKLLGGERVRSVVIMGTGEPLDNYEQVLRFIKLINKDYALNIGMRHITLSTSGLVPSICKLAEEGLQITLSVSLHAPNDALRNELMPINKRYPLSELIPACDLYFEKTGRRVSFEYLLIDKINDQPEHAHQLSTLLKGRNVHVNIIPYNPVAERNFRRSSDATISVFRNILLKSGLNPTIRQEFGGDIDAACGQLRRSILCKKPTDVL